MNEKIAVLKIKTQASGSAAGAAQSNEQVVRVHKKRIVIGSSTSADVTLDDPAVNPIHAIIEISGIDGSPVIYDLASDTGVRVNGEAQVQATLSKDDKIRIGNHQIQVELQDLSNVPQRPEFVKQSFGQKLFVNEKEDLHPLILEEEANVKEIFDYRPEAKQSLQVVMFYKDTILDVEHFVNKNKIVIGPGSSEDFSIPPFLGQKKGGKFNLVTKHSGQYTLHLNDQMDGVISHAGKLVSIKELNQSITSSSQEKTYPLHEKDFAKVKLNDVSFFLNFSPAPPKLKAPDLLKRDPLFAKLWILSFLLTGLLLMTFASLKVDPTIEIEQLPERVATIIYEPKNLPVVRPKLVRPVVKPEPKPVEKEEKKPEKIKINLKPKKPEPEKKQVAKEIQKPKPAPKAKKSSAPKVASKPPKPAPIPKTAKPKKRAGGQAGTGAKAKGPKGSRGKRNAPKGKVAQTKALRPGETKNLNSPAASAPGRSQTKSFGVVDVFKSSKGTLNKILAAGRGGSNSLDKLEGYSGFSTKGEGGLGAAGHGSGGGGKSLGLGGLSNRGAGGGKNGSGLGVLGSGGNILGGSGKLAVDSGGVPEPIVLGGIDEDAIRRAIEAHRDEIKYCYEREINAENPNLSGRVAVRWVIGASGTVTSAGVASTSMKNPNVEGCVVAVIRRIAFPPVRGGGIAEVTYPFVFKPATN